MMDVKDQDVRRPSPAKAAEETGIVGAGPAGLMLACQLAWRGAPFRIFDSRSGPAPESRALAVHARTLEAYAQLGIAERALAQGRKLRALNLHTGARASATRPAHRLDLTRLGEDATPYPYILVLEQNLNERLLLARLEELGGRVEWNTTLTGFDTGADGADLVLRSPGGEKHLRTDWLIGADGAHSAVRHGLGLAFPGARSEDVFFVADLRVESLPPFEASFFARGAGIAIFIPFQEAGLFRLIGMMPRDRDPDAATFAELRPGISSVVGRELDLPEPVWFSTYRVHHRCVMNFRAGRCLLVGDAGHIHSPVGGQGMNTGLLDAWNLGWKLALVARGRAAPALLDSYNDERRAFARRLIHTTDQVFRFMASHAPVRSFARAHVVPRITATALRSAAVRRLVFRTLSQIGFACRDGAITAAGRNMESPRTGAQSGERLPWTKLCLPDGRQVMSFELCAHDKFTVLDLAGGTHLDICRELCAAARLPLQEHVVESAGDDSLAPGGFYLVRPDMFIALAARRLQRADLQRFLAQGLSMTAGQPSVSVLEALRPESAS